jgi:hypothetical protein
MKTAVLILALAVSGMAFAQSSTDTVKGSTTTVTPSERVQRILPAQPPTEHPSTRTSAQATKEAQSKPAAQTPSNFRREAAPPPSPCPAAGKPTCK